MEASTSSSSPVPSTSTAPPPSAPAPASDSIPFESSGDATLDRLVAKRLLYAPPIAPTSCLFCPHPSFPTVQENAAHMRLAHSFVIPEEQYLVDLEGLLKRLGEEVGTWNVCVCCGKGYGGNIELGKEDDKTDEELRKKASKGVEAVRAHMQSKVSFGNVLPIELYTDVTSSHTFSLIVDSGTTRKKNSSTSPTFTISVLLTQITRPDSIEGKLDVLRRPQRLPQRDGKTRKWQKEKKPMETLKSFTNPLQNQTRTIRMTTLYLKMEDPRELPTVIQSTSWFYLREQESVTANTKTSTNRTYYPTWMVLLSFLHLTLLKPKRNLHLTLKHYSLWFR